jgi:Cu-Zn family superoxide dismutase
MRAPIFVLLLAGAAAGVAEAQEFRVAMNLISADGIGEPIGEVAITETPAGVSFMPQLRGLPAGEHGFHLHENGDRGPGSNDEGQMAAGMAAGDHWDLADAGAHRGPSADGHLGDLPVLVVQADGSADGEVTAPRIDDLTRLEGKALMIQAGGDNFSDQPEPLGGGRIACGLIWGSPRALAVKLRADLIALGVEVS